MTETRTLELQPPPGEWAAMELQESATATGPWTAVQAKKVQGPGSFSLAFRPQIANGFYRPVWVPHGGTYAGILEGDVIRPEGRRGLAHGRR